MSTQALLFNVGVFRADRNLRRNVLSTSLNYAASAQDQVTTNFITLPAATSVETSTVVFASPSVSISGQTVFTVVNGALTNWTPINTSTAPISVCTFIRVSSPVAATVELTSGDSFSIAIKSAFLIDDSVASITLTNASLTMSVRVSLVQC